MSTTETLPLLWAGHNIHSEQRLGVIFPQVVESQGGETVGVGLGWRV